MKIIIQLIGKNYFLQGCLKKAEIIPTKLETGNADERN
jgi:hypothetical protein